MNGGGQFFHRIKEQAVKFCVKKTRLRPDFSEYAINAFNHENSVKKRSELAEMLGVSYLSLEKLRCGWDGKFWIFPEMDQFGNIIGLTRRTKDNKKLCYPGSHRGLFYEKNWRRTKGDVYIVEGASDVAAMISAGQCAIGRPSNTGGSDILKYMLDSGRNFIIIGENDKKEHETLKKTSKSVHKKDCECCALCFPGKYGAKTVSKALNIGYVMPPPNVKDVRELLCNSVVFSIKDFSVV